jgi:sugar (pentulose or hexulose) kinase
MLPKRNIAKLAARIAVQAAAVTATTSICDHVIENDDDSPIDIASQITGHMIGISLWDRADRTVDRIADWRIARKEKKANSVTE